MTGETEARRKGVGRVGGGGGAGGGGGGGAYGNGSAMGNGNVGGDGSVSGGPYANGNANASGGHGHEGVALADRECIAYMGTLVRNGESCFVLHASSFVSFLFFRSFLEFLRIICWMSFVFFPGFFLPSSSPCFPRI